MTPEESARQHIDRLLRAAGWDVQDHRRLNLGAARGVAVRETPTGVGPADYVLFVDRQAVGVVEAKPVGTTLSGVARQTARYAHNLPAAVPAAARPLPFTYESTGSETWFRDGRDPDPRSRRVFAVHQPATLAGWLDEPASLRARLQTLPPLPTDGLRDCQVEALQGLDESLAADRPRALVQMATGAGKTFTAVSLVYRLVKHAGLRRVLFLVDRNNLGRQALPEFELYRTPDTRRAFTELYDVQRLTSNAVDPNAKVVIGTIQRLYAILRGDDPDPDADEHSAFEDPAPARTVEVDYNPDLPPETFDLIVVDECHRSIYNVWRQVLDYFDAHVVGLSATPSAHTLGFFDGNLVSEYSHARAVGDRVNVPFDVYRIRTRISEQGATIERGEYVYKRDTRTREQRLEQLDQDTAYAAAHLDRSVVAPDQIRTVVQTFRDHLPAIFPGRTEVPKTLVFAKDDAHAEDIVRTLRQEFGRGDDFAQKISYRVDDPEGLIKDFRSSFNPRIAVSVDMIATGTDIRPLECLLFMRDVKSQVYFDQMKGRGTRTVDPAELQRVTPDAPQKTRFVLVDAVGVTETDKTDTRPLDRDRSLSLGALLDAVALGTRDPDTLSTLAARLDRLRRSGSTRDAQALADAGLDLDALVPALLRAADPDAARQRAAESHPDPSPDQVADAQRELALDACRPLDSPDARDAIQDAARRRRDVLIDTVSQDELLHAGPDLSAADRARATVDSFQAFIEANRDQIDALSLFYRRAYGDRHLTLAQIRELADALQSPPLHLTPEHLWDAYAALERDRVAGAGETRLLADVVQLVRHAIGEAPRLVPHADDTEARFHDWLALQERNGRTFTPDQLDWLALLRDHLAVNLDLRPGDLQRSPFRERGGAHRAAQLFGSDALQPLLAELNDALAP